MGPALSDGRRRLAPGLTARDSILRLSARDSARHLPPTRSKASTHSSAKIIKARGHFPNDDAATKLIWLALRNITAKWERGAPSSRAAMNQFVILYGDRFLPPGT
jgi:transposase-like protein